jgi:putative methionine-R-sulfoxide reductase with GAF domain
MSATLIEVPVGVSWATTAMRRATSVVVDDVSSFIEAHHPDVWCQLGVQRA